MGGQHTPRKHGAARQEGPSGPSIHLHPTGQQGHHQKVTGAPPKHHAIVQGQAQGGGVERYGAKGVVGGGLEGERSLVRELLGALKWMGGRGAAEVGWDGLQQAVASGKNMKEEFCFVLKRLGKGK